MKTICLAVLLISVAALVSRSYAQGAQIGQVLIISAPTLKAGVDDKDFETHVTGDMAPAWKRYLNGVELHLFRAERFSAAAPKVGYIVVWTFDTQSHRKQYGPDSGDSPFPEKVLAQLSSASAPSSAYVSSPGAYTEYVLIGADTIANLPVVDLLGIHYIQVQAEKSAAFEQFVRNRLHPALANITPGMRMLYYKGVRGERAGSYVLIFAISSVAARERYWPTGKPETEATKSAFRPLDPLARELGTYLVPGSYLEPTSGGAAAYYESLVWTDFVRVSASTR